MKCSQCGRQLDRPTVSIGRLHLGPVCAKRLGLLPTTRRRSALLPVVVQDSQLPLFGDAI